MTHKSASLTLLPGKLVQVMTLSMLGGVVRNQFGQCWGVSEHKGWWVVSQCGSMKLQAVGSHKVCLGWRWCQPRKTIECS